MRLRVSQIFVPFLLAALPLLTHSQARATVEVAGGLQTATFNVPEGKLRVILPDDLRAGDHISGTVMAEPVGKNNIERSRNQGRLQGYVVDVGDRHGTMGKDGALRVIVPGSVVNSMPVAVVNSAGHVVDTVMVSAGHASGGPIMPEPLNPVRAKTTPMGAQGPIMPEPLNPVRSNLPMQTPFLAPPISQCGHPFPVHGPFDGDASTTNVTIGGQSVPVIAESPRETIVSAPSNVQGSTAVEVQERGTQTPSSASGSARFVALRLTAGKTQLVRGEKTMLTIQVSGLQNLDRNVPLSLTNQTPSVVSLEGGNTQQFVVEPSQVTPPGVYTVTRVISSLQPGGFDVESDVVYQQAPESSPASRP